MAKNMQGGNHPGGQGQSGFPGGQGSSSQGGFGGN